MTTGGFLALLGTCLYGVIHFGFLARGILRERREPASRVAWVVVMLALPVVGIIAYILLGETSVGRRRRARMMSAQALLPSLATPQATLPASIEPEIPERYLQLFRAGQSTSGFPPVGGNRATLMTDSNATIDAIVADIDAAREHVHLSFYIWLNDRNGRKMVEAVIRAAGRGVACRVLCDGLGSRSLIASSLWRSMRERGAQVAAALPIGNPLLRPLRGRIDLRNHRKIVVIDDRVTYCGSQNVADPEFHIKARFAPWVDLMARFEGPIARQNQRLFAGDWMAQVSEDISDLLRKPLGAFEPGPAAQVIGVGPTLGYSAMPEVFQSLMYAAREELRITTPYYVPDEALQAALRAAARRGVATTLILPAKNDSWIVAAASRSYYAELLEAGVRIFEFEGGLLHSKSLTLDGQVSLIGSANLDRRSFDLNFENNILSFDPQLTRAIVRRQDEYMAHSREVTAKMVAAWSLPRRLWNNSIAMLGPVL